VDKKKKMKMKLKLLKAGRQRDVVLTSKLKTQAKELSRKTLKSFSKLSKSLKTGEN